MIAVEHSSLSARMMNRHQELTRAAFTSMTVLRMIKSDKDGDGGRTFIIDGEGCNEFGHYIVTGEFDPRHSTASMQRQFYCHSTSAVPTTAAVSSRNRLSEAMLQRLKVFLMKIYSVEVLYMCSSECNNVACSKWEREGEEI